MLVGVVVLGQQVENGVIHLVSRVLIPASVQEKVMALATKPAVVVAQA